MKMEQIPMDDILSDELPPPEKPEKPEKPEAEAKPEATAPEKPEEPKYPETERVQSRRKQWREKEMDARGLKRDPETGQFVPKDAEPAAPAAEKPADAAPAKPAETPPAAPVAAPQQEMSDKEKAFLHAMQEERQKRQELERRLQAIETAKTQGAQPGQPEQDKTFWEDPEGFLAKHNETVRREGLNTRLHVSETFARKAHTDFDEKIGTFAELLPKTPGLREQWLNASDPAEFAYAVGRNHLELQQVGSIDAMREKITKETEARVRAQMEAELKAKADELARQRQALPPSLSEARNTAPGNRPVFSGPPSFDDILGS